MRWHVGKWNIFEFSLPMKVVASAGVLVDGVAVVLGAVVEAGGVVGLVEGLLPELLKPTKSPAMLASTIITIKPVAQRGMDFLTGLTVALSC